MRVHTKTFGCSANVAESEIMEGLLSKEHDIIDSEEQADTILINACTVKGDKTVLDEVRRLKSNYPNTKLVIGGCLTPTLRASVSQLDSQASFLTTHNVHQINSVVSSRTPLTLLQPDIQPKVLLPRKRKNANIAIIPISNGCLDHCTYCSTKLSKGNLVSYPEEMILEEVRRSTVEGCKEIWLTSQDTSCYGQDLGTNTAKLLTKLCALDGDFRIRLGMGNPTYFKEFTSELIEALKHDKMYKFVHIPVQAGSDNVLRQMKRRYTVDEFRQLIADIRQQIPEITIATDIIVGFPGETEDNFTQTLALVKELKMDIANISRFIPRRGTAAEKLTQQVHGNIKKERSRQLTQLNNSIVAEKNKEWIGWEGEVLITDVREQEADGRGRTVDGRGPTVDGRQLMVNGERLTVDGGRRSEALGRNFAYKPIVLKGTFSRGETVRVKITESTIHHLIGTM